jgi:hypothetical protein
LNITVNNETDYPAQVSVTSADNEAWLALTTVRPHSERVVKEVIDQGETWTFRFKYIHIYEEELELARRSSTSRSGRWRYCRAFPMLSWRWG